MIDLEEIIVKYLIKKYKIINVQQRREIMIIFLEKKCILIVYDKYLNFCVL